MKRKPDGREVHTDGLQLSQRLEGLEKCVVGDLYMKTLRRCTSSHLNIETFYFWISNEQMLFQPKYAPMVTRGPYAHVRLVSWLAPGKAD